MRQGSYHKKLFESINIIKKYIKEHELFATALVVVNRETIRSVNQEVEAIYQLGVFDKIKILEMLPLGSAKSLLYKSLNSKIYLDTLARLHQRYIDKVDIGAPLWRVREDKRRGCLVGYKDLVVGPNGQLAGCSLLFYLNNLSGNLRGYDGLKEAWEKGFDSFRHKENFSVEEDCKECAFYKNNLCWGGCIARASIFGRKLEKRRSCGIIDKEHSTRLYQNYLEYKRDNRVESFLNLEDLVVTN
jgi:radical SAM protein with 4Fe4S-binding SPASM domain